MDKKIIYYSIFILLIFSQCTNSKKTSDETDVKLEIIPGNWVITDWTADGKPADIPAEKPITLNFDDQQKKLNGSAGCNRYFGEYKLEGKTLSTGPIGSTMMLCDENIMEWETRFLKLLESGVSISIQKNILILEDKNNLLHFKPIQK